MELLIGLGVISIMVGASTYALVSVMRTSDVTEQNQSAGLIGNSLLESAFTLAESNWNSIYNLKKTSSNHYFLARSSTTTPTPIAGDESVLEQDILNGLVGYWKFDEAGGTWAHDSSGNGNLGTLTNSPIRTASTTCKIGSCLAFNGTSQYINLGSNSSLNQNIFSFAAWIKPVSVTQGTIFGGFRTNGDTKNFVRLSNGKIGVDQYPPSGGAINSNTTLLVNNWYHIAVIQNGTYWAVYVNGVLDNSNNSAETYSGGTPTQWNIGRRELVGSEGYYNGLIDDVRVYDRALSAAEVYQLYNSPVYTRYFYVDNVNRKACGSGEITASAVTSCNGSANDISEDPASQKITIGTIWDMKGVNEVLSNSIYVTRWINSAASQTSWDGNSGTAGSVSDFGTNYFDYSNIATTTSGSIKVVLP
jgi:type II secretory pathway pseudopilin PulG